MQLAAVRVGLGLAVVASGALVGFLFLREQPEVAPVAPRSPPPPRPAPPVTRAIPVVTPISIQACGTTRRPRRHAGDVDPHYLTRDLALLDRDGHPIETLRVDPPREPALSGQGHVVQVHDLDDPDETPCATSVASTTVWRTDPMVVQVRYNVAAGCPDVCVVVTTPRPAELNDH